MTNETVTVPIELTVTDIRTSDVDLKDVQKSIESKLAGIAKSASDVLGRNLDTSKLNKTLTSAMDKVTNSYQRLAVEQSKFQEALTGAGSSSPKYKEEFKRIQGQIDSQTESYASLIEHLESNPIWKSANEKLDKGMDMSELVKSEEEVMKMYLRVLTDRDNILDDLKSQLPNPQNFIGSATSSELQKIINLYYNMFNAINKVESATRSWNETVANNQMTDEYTKKLGDLTKYEKKLETVREKARKMSELGATDKSWKSLYYDANLLEEKIVQIIEELQNMVRTGKAFRFNDGDSAQQLDLLNERLINTVDSLRELRDAPKTIKFNMSSLFKSIHNFCVSIERGISNIISKFKQLGKVSDGVHKKSSTSFKKILRNLLMLTFGLRSTFFLVRRVRAIFIESFKEMATQIPEVNVSVSSFMTSLNQLKGSIATAFQPIVTAAIPALNQLIAALTNAMNALGKFFATLTGQGYIYKFTAAQVDYAESLDKTAGSAKKAQKSLMGFDEINRLNAEDSGSGGSGNVPTGTWEKETLEGMSSLAELIKEAWSKNDFTEVGEYIGNGLLEALRIADEWIITNGYSLASKIGNSLATLLTGVIEVNDLGSQVGTTLAHALNMGLVGIEKFFSTANWTSLGQFIADWANSSVTKFDWTLLGKTIASTITAGVNTWWRFVGEFDFSDLGNSISTSINSLFDNVLTNNSASRLGQAISNTVKGIIETLTTTVRTTDWSAVGKVIGEVLGNIDWSGIIIDLGKLVRAIIEALGETFRSWKDTDPVSAGVVNMLALAFTTLKITSLLSGIASICAKIVEVFAKYGLGDKIGKVLSPAFNSIKLLLSPIIGGIAGAFEWLGEVALTVFTKVVDVVKYAFNLIGFEGVGVVGVITGAVTAISNFIDMLINGFNWVNEVWMLVGIAIAAVGATIAGFVTGPVAALVAGIVAAVATIVIVVKDNWSTIQEIWAVVAEWFTTTVINPVRDGFQNAVNGVKNFFINCWNDIKSAWNNAPNWFSSKVNEVSNAFKVIRTLEQVFNVVWTAIKNGCKAAFNTVISFVERGINSLIRGVNKVISGINKLAGGAAKLAGVKFSGISTIPTVSLPRLAKGAVIPPNQEFMAILGDQKHGTNIEAPLDTIKQAVAEELMEYIDAMMVGFQAVVDAVESKDLSVRIGDTEIGKAAERYTTRQAFVRGTL